MGEPMGEFEVMDEFLDEKIRSLEELFHKEGQKCLIKIHIEYGQRKDNEKCFNCDGNSSVILCADYTDIPHLIDSYKRYKKR